MPINAEKQRCCFFFWSSILCQLLMICTMLLSFHATHSALPPGNILVRQMKNNVHNPLKKLWLPISPSSAASPHTAITLSHSSLPLPIISHCTLFTKKLHTTLQSNARNRDHTFSQPTLQNNVIMPCSFLVSCSHHPPHHATTHPPSHKRVSAL